MRNRRISNNDLRMSSGEPRSGMALIVTLGILAVVTLAVMAFLVSIRTERQAARNHLDRQICREYVRVGVIQAMENYVPEFLLPQQERVYPVDGWMGASDPRPEWDRYLRGESIGSFGQKAEEDLLLFRGAVTNLVPPILRADAGLTYAGWAAYIVSTNQGAHGANEVLSPLDVALNGVTNGRIAFLIINCSGFRPPEALADEFNPSPHFTTQADVPTNATDEVFHVAYDHNPYQRYANPDRVGTLDAGVTNRLDVNTWTNTPVLTSWLLPSALELAACGYTDPTAKGTAQNLLDFMDADRIPLTTYRTDPADRTGPDGRTGDPLVRPCRVDYGLEDLPMLNEVAITEVTDLTGDARPIYSVDVELWYPFLPALSPQRMELWVGVYTNSTDIPSADAPCRLDEPTGLFGFTNELPQLSFPDRPFHVTQSPPSRRVRLVGLLTNAVPISDKHPVWVQPKLFVLDTNVNAYVCTDEMLRAADGTPYCWTAPGSVQVRDPRRNLLAPSDPSDTSDLSDWSDIGTLWTTNANCTVADAPFVHPNAPLASIGEIGYVYASGTTGSVDFATTAGATTLDRFAVFPPGTNRAARNRIQANSGYTNIVRRLFESTVAYNGGATNNLPPYAQPDGLAAAYQMALHLTEGQGWTCFSNMVPDVVREITAAGRSAGALDAASPALIEDLVRSLPDRVTFRQNIFVVIVAAQRLSPTGKPIADQRAAATVVRDAYTGGWFVHDWYWLND